MKILIIAMDVGDSAPGIVYERLIQGLSSYHNVDVLTANFNPTLNLSKVCDIKVSKRAYIHPRIQKLFISLLGVSPYDCFWAWKSIRIYKTKIKPPFDIILSFLSFQNYSALIAGVFLSKHTKSKLAVHMVDAIPAPNGWLEFDKFFGGLKKMMGSYLSKADALFSSNYQMLNYQLTTFIPKVNLITDVIYNPYGGEKKEFPIFDSTINSFIYTGGIYGVRKPGYILRGFEKLLKSYPNSKLLFIGSQLLPNAMSGINPETQKKIEIVPFMRDLDLYYNSATALLDIDADIENDVFLSSKIINYLFVNRMIISETGSNSPSRHLFRGISSIIQCDHDPDQLCAAMEKSIAIKNKIDFSDREKVIKLFQLDNVIPRMNNMLEQMIAIKETI